MMPAKITTAMKAAKPQPKDKPINATEIAVKKLKAAINKLPLNLSINQPLAIAPKPPKANKPATIGPNSAGILASLNKVGIQLIMA